MPKRVLVCGGQDYAHYDIVDEILSGIHRGSGISVIIQGGALGTDRFAKTWAINNNVDFLQFDADWNKYGRAAGPIRNQKMIDDGLPDIVVAFPGGKGTANMVKIARRALVTVMEIED